MSAEKPVEVHEPIVTIGVPLFNSASYLASALDSLIAQTFGRFEIVISDNGSTDGTEEICRRYAALDHRIRYFRHDVNKGATWNHNFLIKEARGRYFRWHHYDDLCEPRHLEQCVAALAANPRAVLAYPRTTLIDSAGRITSHYDDRLALSEDAPHARLRHLLCNVYLCNPVLGLIRLDAMRRTALHGAYVAADHVLLAELAMQGPWLEIPEALFFRRFHAAKSTEANRTKRDRAAWFDPQLRKGTFFWPNLRLFSERLKAVSRARIGLGEKLLCAWVVITWQSGFALRLLRERWSRRIARFVEWLGFGEKLGKS
jgi:glycosyltransferase involved in cell wall biosynthesis